jgi:hypothetical protein
MHASAGVAAAAAVLRRFPRLPLPAAARPVSVDGLAAYSMAMHVHSSFSEQDASMDSQLFQASKNSADVLWWTDHDTRMDGIGYSSCRPVAGRRSADGLRGVITIPVTPDGGSDAWGAMTVSKVASRRLVASATGVPAGGTVQILHGAVDYAGAAALSANTKVIGSYTAAQLAGRSVAQQVDTSADSFVRTQVLDSSGTLAALSNPVWLLRSAPPGGIPAPRQS